MKTIFSPRLRIALLAAALLLFPIVFSGAFARDIGAAFLLAAISASAWNIVGGYAGQVSVGHSMFFGLGAYMPLLFYSLFGWSPIVGIPVGIVFSIALAVVIGLIQAASAYWLGAIYKDIVVYGLFVALLWLRPQGLMGKA